MREVKRSSTSRRTMNAVAIVFVSFSTLAYSSWGYLAIRGDGVLDDGRTLAFAFFMVACAVLFLCLLAIWEDTKRLGLKRQEQRRWEYVLLVFGPIAMAIYWYGYVRHAEIEEPELPKKRY
jgi:hypothetical protein